MTAGVICIKSQKISVTRRDKQAVSLVCCLITEGEGEGEKKKTGNVSVLISKLPNMEGISREKICEVEKVQIRNI